MKNLRKAFSIVIIVLLLASMAMLIPIAPVTSPAVTQATSLKIVLPNGEQNMTVPPEWIGDNYNISIVVENVVNLYTFAIELNWSTAICEYTGQDRVPAATIALGVNDRIWIDPYGAFAGLTLDVGTTGINNTLGFLGIGASGVGMWTDGQAPDGNITLFIIEFHVKDYGSNWIKFIKLNQDPGTVFFNNIGVKITVTDVKAPPPYSAYNAMLKIPPPPPYPPEAEKTEDPDPPIVNQNVTVTVTQTKAGFDGAATHDISNVTIDWDDGSPTEWKVPVAGVATFIHNYTLEDDYTIKVYCYAEGMPPNLAWYNITNPITVVPEFPAYLLMPLFLTATIIAVVVGKTTWSKRRKRPRRCHIE